MNQHIYIYIYIYNINSLQENAKRNRRKETMQNAKNRQPNTKWKYPDYKRKRINKHCLAASGDARMNDDWTSVRLQAQ